MIEQKYRGLHIEKGTWVYGNGIVIVDEDYVAIPQTKDITSNDYAIKLCKVVVGSACRGLGFPDQNGIDIYENDIVEDEVRYWIRYGEYYFDDAEHTGFYSQQIGGRFIGPISKGDMQYLRLIGNSIQNPELLTN